MLVTVTALIYRASTKARAKEYSAMKLTLMLMGGSAFILVALLAYSGIAQDGSIS